MMLRTLLEISIIHSIVMILRDISRNAKQTKYVLSFFTRVLWSLRQLASSSFVMTRYARAKQKPGPLLRPLPCKRHFIAVWTKVPSSKRSKIAHVRRVTQSRQTPPNKFQVMLVEADRGDSTSPPG